MSGGRRGEAFQHGQERRPRGLPRTGHANAPRRGLRLREPLQPEGQAAGALPRRPRRAQRPLGQGECFCCFLAAVLLF